jgi:hypothetical protein
MVGKQLLDGQVLLASLYEPNQVLFSLNMQRLRRQLDS